jgi:hypothetical protein
VKKVRHIKTELTLVTSPVILITSQHIRPGKYDERFVSDTFEYASAYEAANHTVPLSEASTQSFIESGTSGIAEPGVFYSRDLYALVDAFEENLKQTMPSETIIGESIVEYQIFADLARLMINPGAGIRNFVRNFRNYFDNLPRGRQSSFTLGQATRAFVKTSANKHLAYQFGVKPAVNEVSLLLQARAIVNARRSALSSAAGSYVPIRVRQKAASPFSNNPLTTGSTTTLVWQRQSRDQIANIGCYARVRHDIDTVSAWKYYCDLFGLHKVPGLIWELVPYSFVVDWVTDVQERINRASTAPLWSPFSEVQAVCSSYKTAITDHLYLVPGNALSASMPWACTTKGTVLVAKRSTSDYERFPGLPEASGTLDYSVWQDPSKRALTASMLANRFLPTYRRIDLSKLK